VAKTYDEMLRRLGSGLEILGTVPVEEIRRHISRRMAEAIQRVRSGAVIRSGGYDGEFGVIRVFDPVVSRKPEASGGLFAPGVVEVTPVVKSPVVARVAPASVIPAQMLCAVLEESGARNPLDGLDP
ncbi:MAG: hypothetical protein HQM00_12895, partial [Magnetococcales bacterium]|nr:hypothetical protein [Magnetococcales bacterium]